MDKTTSVIILQLAALASELRGRGREVTLLKMVDADDVEPES